MMTVGELRKRLELFPPNFPIFVSTDQEGRRALRPDEVVMNLVHPERGKIISDDDPSTKVPQGFIDSVVIYLGCASNQPHP